MCLFELGSLVRQFSTETRRSKTMQERYLDHDILTSFPGKVKIPPQKQVCGSADPEGGRCNRLPEILTVDDQHGLVYSIWCSVGGLDGETVIAFLGGFSYD